MIKLGSKAKDVITGFSGIVVSRVQYITGCDQYCLTPKLKDGLVVAGEYFDENRLEVTGKGVRKSFTVGNAPGGPQRDAPKR